MPGTLLRVATAGSVDDGKSTLIGRLLHDAKGLFDDQLDAVRDASERRGDEHLELALLTDGLRAEREQGITIDVAYRYFATPQRTFILADTPGHVQYTRNMVTGASTADAAVVLVDAQRGLTEQSRRHAAIAALLRVPHLVLAVNKVDLIGFDEGRITALVEEFRAHAERLGVRDVRAVPVSALHGDNVVDRSEHTPWYDGPPLLELLEAIPAGDAAAGPGRFPVQSVTWVPQLQYRAYAGQVASGVLRPGDEVVVLPSGRRTSIASVDTYDGERAEAPAGLSVLVRLADDVDVSRGDMIAVAASPPAVTQDVAATVCWLSETTTLIPGARYTLRHTTRTTRAIVSGLDGVLDVTALTIGHADTLRLNDIGRVHLRTSTPLALDDYATSRATGAFLLIDDATGATVAAGMAGEGLG